MSWRTVPKKVINSILRPLGLELRALVNDRDRRIRHDRELTPSIIRKYLDTCSPKILQIAAGPEFQAECYRNWLNSDIENPVSCEGGFYSIHLDLTEAFPIPDNSLDYVFSQQGIEHFSYNRGAEILRECLRVLKPGGRARIETPNLNYFIDRYRANDRPIFDAIHQFTKVLGAPPTHLSSLNSIFLQFGHQYVYDIQTLSKLCCECGFDRVHEVDMRETEIVPFQVAIAFNPGSNPDPYYIETSFALEMEKSRQF